MARNTGTAEDTATQDGTQAPQDAATEQAPTDAATQPADGEAQTATGSEAAPADGATPAPAKAKAKRQNRNTYTVPVTIPTPLHELLKAKATEDKTTVTEVARKLLAGYVEYTLPLVAARAPKHKFASKAEAANFRKERNARAKALLAALDAGEVSEETLAKYLAAQTAAKPIEASAPAAEASTPAPEGEAVPA